MAELAEYLKSRNVLKTKNISDAFREIDRKDFVRTQDRPFPYNDGPLPIGFGQTISQPYTVAFMLELLEAQNGDNIMDVGFGSGWQTALLAHIVGGKGHIYAIERIPEIYEFGKKNVDKYAHLVPSVSFYNINAARGLPDVAGKIGGFDRIIAAASLWEVPEEWRSQLKKGGTLVYPRKNSIFKETKLNNGKFHSEEFFGFVFVPFVDL